MCVAERACRLLFPSVLVVVLRRSPSALHPRHWYPDEHRSQLFTRQLHTSFEHLVKRQRVTVPLKPKRETELRCVSVFANQHTKLASSALLQLQLLCRGFLWCVLSCLKSTDTRLPISRSRACLHQQTPDVMSPGKLPLLSFNGAGAAALAGRSGGSSAA